jgi:hypothetical protein
MTKSNTGGSKSPKNSITPSDKKSFTSSPAPRVNPGSTSSGVKPPRSGKPDGK